MKPILTAKNLTKSYAKGILALNKVSFTLDQGKVLVVMGPSGSGKSTLIRTINGLPSIGFFAQLWHLYQKNLSKK